MNIDTDESGGADVFWPGYVDAVTNLVLNLLFVVVIMTVAVFIFAMELGRRHVNASPPTEVTQNADQIGSTSSNAVTPDNVELQKKVEALQQQVAALKVKERDAQDLQARLDALEKAAPGKLGKSKVVKATVRDTQPDSTLEKLSSGLVVDFVDNAITLSDKEAQEVREQLVRIVNSGGAQLLVNVPTGFTEARRLGFYRAMAVRNLLIDMKLPADRIEVSVREGKPTSDASLVLVSPAQR